MTDTKIKQRIQALLAKAQGTDNEHEAAAFMAKAEQLLEEHQIELWQLGDADDLMGSDIMFSGTSSSPTWRRHLLFAVAKYYGCRSVRQFTPKQTRSGMDYTGFDIHIIGRESSRITVNLMMPFILEQCNEAGRRLFRQGHAGSAAALTRRVANALCARIQRLIYEQERAVASGAKGSALQSRALVVVDELKSFIDKEFGKLSKPTTRVKSTTAAARDAAERVSLYRQTGGAGQLKIGRG